MSSYQPYFYIVGWKALDWCYAGIEFKNGRKVAHPDNLFRKTRDGHRYATSSARVQKLTRFFGDPEVLEIHVCDSAEQAFELEYQFLTLLDLKNNPRWINANVGGSVVLDAVTVEKIRQKITGTKRSDEARRKMSAKAKGRPAWNKGIPSPRKGGTLPASHVAAIKASKLANPQVITQETRERMRASKGSIARETALGILNASGTPKEIAERFDVPRHLVYKIKAGTHWICGEA